MTRARRSPTRKGNSSSSGRALTIDRQGVGFSGPFFLPGTVASVVQYGHGIRGRAGVVAAGRLPPLRVKLLGRRRARRALHRGVHGFLHRQEAQSVSVPVNELSMSGDLLEPGAAPCAADGYPTSVWGARSRSKTSQSAACGWLLGTYLDLWDLREERGE